MALVAFVHGEVDDPAEAIGVFLAQIQQIG
jgi:hypothetical protein